MVFWKIELSRCFIPRVVQMRSFCDISAQLPCTQYADATSTYCVRGATYALGTTQNLGLQTKWVWQSPNLPDRLLRLCTHNTKLSTHTT